MCIYVYKNPPGSRGGVADLRYRVYDRRMQQHASIEESPISRSRSSTQIQHTHNNAYFYITINT